MSSHLSPAVDDPVNTPGPLSRQESAHTDLVMVPIPRELTERVIELNARRDVTAAGDLALASAGLPVDLESPEHVELMDDAVELFDDLGDLIEDAAYAAAI